MVRFGEAKGKSERKEWQIGDGTLAPPQEPQPSRGRAVTKSGLLRCNSALAAADTDAFTRTGLNPLQISPKRGSKYEMVGFDPRRQLWRSSSNATQREALQGSSHTHQPH